MLRDARDANNRARAANTRAREANTRALEANTQARRVLNWTLVAFCVVVITNVVVAVTVAVVHSLR